MCRDRSHTSIGKKDLNLAELRLKLEGMIKEERILRRTIAHVSEILKHFQHDFYELAQLIQVRKSSKMLHLLIQNVIHIS